MHARIKSKEVLIVCFDTSAVNSGTGKVRGACFWYAGAFCRLGGNVLPSFNGMFCRYGLN